MALKPDDAGHRPAITHRTTAIETSGNAMQIVMTKRMKRVLGLFAMLAAIAVIATFTIGRELYAGRRPDLDSFAIVHFAGYLFFLLMPVEVLVPYYLAHDHPGSLLVPLAVVTAMTAQIIDYGIGYLLSDRIIGAIYDFIGQKRFQKAERAMHRHGRWAVLVFNLLPLSSPNLLLAAGMLRFGLLRAMTYSFLGLTTKYAALVYMFSA